MKKLSAGLVIALVLAGAIEASAQGSLSSQVLRLLTRANYWGAKQTFGNQWGLTLEESQAAVADPTDTLENRGGNLYWDGSLVTTSSSTGTVVSVGLALPDIFTITGSPVTSTGTLTGAFATQPANVVFAGPLFSPNGVPTFRALVDADIPNNIVIDSNGTVTWDSVNKAGSTLADLAVRSASSLNTGTLPDAVFPATLPAISGVNLSNLTATNLIGTIACARLPVLTGDITTSAGSCTTALAATAVTAGSYTFASITVDAKGRITAASNGSGLSGTVAVANGGTNITSYTTGDIIYASGSTALSKLADIATGNVLISGGVSTAPSWGKVALATAISGTLPLANGGTGLTTASADTALVSTGSAWAANALANGVLSYSTSTHTFTVPTTYLIGTGAPTASASNILLRATTAKLLEVMEGTQGTWGSIGVKHITAGTDVNLSLLSDNNQHEFRTLDLAPASLSTDSANIQMLMSTIPSTDETHSFVGLYSEMNTNGTHNYSGTDIAGVYAASYPGQVPNGGGGETTSGTFTADISGLVAAAKFSGTGTATVVFAVKGICCSLDPASGTLGAITTSGFFHATKPVTGATPPVNNKALWIEDQTNGGAFVPSTSNYAIHVGTATAAKDFIVQADGEVLALALKTTGAATGKKVVCVDVTTGKLYASSTGTDCSN